MGITKVHIDTSKEAVEDMLNSPPETPVEASVEPAAALIKEEQDYFNNPVEIDKPEYSDTSRRLQKLISSRRRIEKNASTIRQRIEKLDEEIKATSKLLESTSVFRQQLLI